MQQAADFRAEAEALAAVTSDLTDADFARETLFKSWTIGDVIGHLHMFDIAAELSLADEAAFGDFLAPVYKAMGEGRSMIEAQNVWLAEKALSGCALRDAWAAQAARTAAAYSDVDPKKRLKWAGPDMSARSMVTARQMETWAHGQEVFDALGRDRVEADRVKNICHLGVTTYGWTFAVRRMTPPEPVPFVRLIAPSGAVWEWGAVDEANMVSGSAVGFAQTVAQTRNVADTDIETTGEAAALWMANAQCFAGAPNDPPAPGARHKAKEA
ncbi:MAG: TIGR03084 family metal-binding protein [Pseudomonadota bacterium]